ncbi:MAG TPA: hypothetical protein VK302_12945 [Terriglobales bacterium]|nr:hypothetical protein [Terriglobales bacterium]HXP80520.1 hypothetical protein [Verrucomicrobiae bacterium]
MTAEIAILNRNAVAMAADSAVTLQLPGGQKIYNTVNKLFTLSKYRPVGVMVYGSADFMRIPWETIIKTYRAELYDKKYDDLAEYASDFINFFERENILFPEEVQSESASDYLRLGFFQLRRRIDAEVGRVIKNLGSIDEEQVETLVREKSADFLGELEKSENLPGFGPDDLGRCAARCEGNIRDAIQDVFEKLPIERCSEQLQQAGSLILCKKFTRRDYSGIVIAGYGEKDVFPNLLSYECECVINNKLRYIEVNRVRIGTTGQTVIASVNPFAQREMVNRFMEGVDPKYTEEIEKYVSALLTDGYPGKIAEALSGKISTELQDSLRKELTELGSKLAQDFADGLRSYRQSQFIMPVIDSVASLPKDELAAMAESLVNLTAFKRRMTSVETDTVALPIDVAVISKGDGFIWIKRKHYFEPAFNPHFFSNYYRKDETR